MHIDDSAVNIEPSATQPVIQPPTDSSSTSHSVIHVAHTSSPVQYTPTSTVTPGATADHPSLELKTIVGIVSGTVFATVIILTLVLLVVICMRRKRGNRRETYGDRPNVLWIRRGIHNGSFVLLTCLRRLGSVTMKPKNASRYSSVDQRTGSPQSDSISQDLNVPTIDSAEGSPIPQESSIELFENPSYSALVVASYEGTDSPDFEEHVYDVVPVRAPIEYEIPRSLSPADSESYIYEDANTIYAEIL